MDLIKITRNSFRPNRSDARNISRTTPREEETFDSMEWTRPSIEREGETESEEKERIEGIRELQRQV